MNWKSKSLVLVLSSGPVPTAWFSIQTSHAEGSVGGFGRLGGYSMSGVVRCINTVALSGVLPL